MQLDPAKVYSMPLIMGPVFDRESLPGRIYGETESLAVTFRTDAGAARALVPDCFSIRMMSPHRPSSGTSTMWTSWPEDSGRLRRGLGEIRG